MFMTNALLNAGAARLSLSTQSARDETRRDELLLQYYLSYHFEHIHNDCRVLSRSQCRVAAVSTKNMQSERSARPNANVCIRVIRTRPSARGPDLWGRPAGRRAGILRTNTRTVERGETTIL